MKVMEMWDAVSPVLEAKYSRNVKRPKEGRGRICSRRCQMQKLSEKKEEEEREVTV